MGNLPGTSSTLEKPEGGAAKPPFVRIYVKDEFYRSHKLNEGVFVVGRDPECDIPIDNRFISRRHFQLEWRGGNRLYIQDLGSANGTLVNGEKVTRIPLGHGDEIRAGEARLVVSHRAYKKSNVIPFPDIRTDPQIVPPVKEEPKPRITLKPVPIPAVEEGPPELLHSPIARRTRAAVEIPAPRRVVPLWIQLALIISTAAALALGFRSVDSKRLIEGGRIQASRFVDGVKSLWPSATPPEIVSISPTEKKKTTTTRKRRKSAPKKKSTTRTAKKKGKRLKSAKTEARVRRKKELAARKKKKARSAANDLVASLDSIDQISASMGDLGEAVDHLKVKKGRRLSSNLVALKKIDKTRAETVAVELTMPRAEDFEAAERAAKKKKRGKQELTEMVRIYQRSLREKIDVIGVEKCYSAHAQGGVVGKITVYLTIAGSGKVRKSGIRSSNIKNKALRQCMVRQMKRLKLAPPPWPDFTVTYAFRFGVTKIQF